MGISTFKNRVRIGVGIGRPDSNIDPIRKLNEILEKIKTFRQTKKYSTARVSFRIYTQ